MHFTSFRNPTVQFVYVYGRKIWRQQTILYFPAVIMIENAVWY